MPEGKVNVIFLDIDGVLNSVDSAIAFHHLKPKRLRTRIIEERLDPVCISLLKALCDKTEAKIVVSSVWRIGRTGDDFIDLFKSYGWEGFPYLDATKRLYGQCRGDEIKEWLDRNPDTEYVIFDDDSDMLESQRDRFIHVSNVNGLRSKHYCQALRLFGKPDERLESQVNFVRKEHSNAKVYVD